MLRLQPGEIYKTCRHQAIDGTVRRREAACSRADRAACGSTRRRTGSAEIGWSTCRSGWTKTEQTARLQRNQDDPTSWCYQWCGLRPSVLGQDRSETRKIGLALAGLVLFCEKRSCHARRHNDLEGHSNFSSTIYSFSILCLEHHYCGDQQWRSLT